MRSRTRETVPSLHFTTTPEANAPHVSHPTADSQSLVPMFAMTFPFVLR